MIRVACAVEGEDYVRHCSAMLHSLIAQHSSGDVEIHYLYGPDTSERGRQQLRAMVERLGGTIEFHFIPDERVQGLPVEGFTGKATWYRLFLPELLPSVERVLYLDSDLLILDSLTELFELDLGGWVLGAVTNVPQRADLGRATWVGLPDDRAYFNAGVLLMNLELMRREGTVDGLLRWSVANAEKYGWRDQDALNVVLYKRRLPLHPRWNCMNSIIHFSWAADLCGAKAVEDARARPAIRHFEGPAWGKPWHLLSPPDMRRLYASHRRETPWPRVWPTGCTPRNLLRYVFRRKSTLIAGHVV